MWELHIHKREFGGKKIVGISDRFIMFCLLLTSGLMANWIIELIRRPRERVDCRTLSDTITSREEEDRHQRLIKENKELLRQIIEKEDQIRQVQLLLQERHAARNQQMASSMGGGRLTQYTDTSKDITNDFTSDSGFITGTSIARSSRSDFEFSESYL
ncbi:gamma-aminobutyric acid type B receptor subunit 1 [Caerostris extrusa]|uniref:Gamma-aminobutyric acid type B receptor subunit 1 n=1 Tax=Caerostris extrusa TaxID=172846 RepID=A0AAV4TB69_CAEEX|nr:gamma-aminobutyric acid type B receptor subunit 1 [Caerostris extrusa]